MWSNCEDTAVLTNFIDGDTMSTGLHWPMGGSEIETYGRSSGILYVPTDSVVGRLKLDEETLKI